MKYRLLDIIACPICKHFPLELYVFEYSGGENNSKNIRCELFCAYKKTNVSEQEPSDADCTACAKTSIKNGLLICPNCKKWYPINDEIPALLPDDLRKTEDDLIFLKKYMTSIPQFVLSNYKPFYNLK
jgi:uncharacterized protein YbaR (Trm112 family)